MAWFRILKKPISDIHDKMDVPRDMRTIATPNKGVFSKDDWRNKSPVERMESNIKNPYGLMGDKPSGLWYGLGTQWVDWVCENMGCNSYKYFYEVKIIGNVLQLKTKQEHIDFWEKYKDDTFVPRKSNWFTSRRNPSIKDMRDDWKHHEWRPMINWERVQEEYDGIEAMGGTFKGEALDDNMDANIDTLGFPRGSMNWLSSWDVDSGCVWNTNAIKVGQLLFSEDDPEWTPVEEYDEEDD